MVSGIPSPADLFFDEIRPATEKMLKDGLTGYWWGIQYRGSVAERALPYSQENSVRAFCVGFDIRNVGGANAILNWTGVANLVFRPFAKFFEQALQKTLGHRAQYLLFRQGGDEFSAIVVGCPGKAFTEDDLKQSLGKFVKMVQEYCCSTAGGADCERLSEIPNPKYPGSVGVGVVCAYAPLELPNGVDAAFEEVDRRIEKEKKKWQLTNNGTQDKYFTSGIRIHFLEQGKGEPVVLIHGHTGNVETNWKNWL